MVVDGVRLPKHIVSEFPTEEMRVELFLKKLRVNVEIDPDKFDIDRHVKALIYEGFDMGDLEREDFREVLP